MNKKIIATLAVLCLATATVATAKTVANYTQTVEPQSITAQAEAEAAVINDVNYTDNYAGFAGNCVSVGFASASGMGDWAPYSDTSKIEFVDKNGNNVLTSVDVQGNYLNINRGGRVAEIGDKLTLKAGFVWGDKEIKADVTYEYTAVGTPFKKVVPKDLAVTSVNINSDWGNITLIEMNTEIANRSGDWGPAPAAGTVLVTDKDGNNKPITNMVTAEKFIWIFAPLLEVGDKVTLKAGLVFGEKELAEDVTYVYAVAGSPFTKEIAQREAAKINDVNYTNYGGWAGMCVSVGFTTPTDLGDWAKYPDTSKIEYVDKDGNNVMNDVEVQGNYLNFNRGGRAAEVGDKVTFKAGFIWGERELKEDVTYVYSTANAPFTIYVKEPDKSAMTINQVSYVPEGWGAPTAIVKFNMADVTKYGTYASGDLANIEYVNAYGETKPLADCTYVNEGHFIMRLAEQVNPEVVNSYTPMVGDKITFKANWQIMASDGQSIEYLQEAATYIFNGTTFELYVPATHDVTTLTITNEETENVTRINTVLKLETEVNEGALTTVKFTTSNSDIATVDASGNVKGISVGNVTITATAGSKTATFNVVVKPAPEATGIEMVNQYDIYVEEGAEIVMPNDFSAHIIYDDEGTEVYGEEFALTTENTVLGAYDETTATVPATITYEGKTYNLNLNVVYYTPYEMQVKEVAIVEWFAYNFFVEFPDTSINVANITNGELIPDAGKFEYKRADGTEVHCGYYNLGGGNIAVLPAFINGDVTLENFSSDPYYMAGDTITLKAGFAGYRWTGELAPTATDNAAIKPHSGMIVRECVLAEDVVFKFDGSVWGIFVEYTDVTIAKETVEVVIGKTASVGASRLPENATEGTFEYTSSDETIATVSERGVINARKEGTVTITVKLSGGAAGEKTKTVTVNVKDAIASLKLEGELKVKQGTKELDLSGITAKFVYASGKEETADLTGAEVVGYDKDAVGETEVTVKVVKDGVAYNGSLNVTVEKKGGCGSSVAGVGALISAVAVAGVALSKKRKED